MQTKEQLMSKVRHWSREVVDEVNAAYARGVADGIESCAAFVDKVALQYRGQFDSYIESEMRGLAKELRRTKPKELSDG